MKTLICGSMAYDTIMVFKDQFKKHILPEQIHILNVAFLVPEMRREYGGCAGNIAYNLQMLGGHPLIMATVGDDFGPYAARLQQLLVFVEQAQRGIAGTVGQGIQIVRQSEQRAAYGFAAQSTYFFRLRQFLQQFFQLGAKYRQPRQGQHAQHAAEAVQLFPRVRQRLLVAPGG